MRKQTLRHAFTLVEMMVVIVILGLLAGLVVPNLIGKSDDAKVKLTQIQIRQIGEALKLFKLDNGRYPTMEEGLNALLKKPDNVDLPRYSNGGYLGGKNLPQDPWNKPFYYFNDGEDNIDVVSLGSDAKEGGEGDKADLKLSELR